MADDSPPSQDATNGDKGSRLLLRLDEAFFERVQGHLGAELGREARKELQDAMWKTWLDIAQHRHLTLKNADRLHEISNDARSLYTKLVNLKKDCPGLLDGT